ncbi:hypothetical protein CR513_20125, partial [Mucuna pruriens]
MSKLDRCREYAWFPTLHVDNREDSELADSISTSQIQFRQLSPKCTKDVHNTSLGLGFRRWSYRIQALCLYFVSNNISSKTESIRLCSVRLHLAETVSDKACRVHIRPISAKSKSAIYTREFQFYFDGIRLKNALINAMVEAILGVDPLGLHGLFNFKRNNPPRFTRGVDLNAVHWWI